MILKSILHCSKLKYVFSKLCQYQEFQAGIILKFKFRKGKSIVTICVPMKRKMHRSEDSSQTIKTMLVGLSSNVGRL